MERQNLERRVIYRGRKIDLALQAIVLPDGSITHREVVLHRGAVALVPMVDPDHVCLVRNHRYAVSKTLLEVPAGTIDPDESPDETARRELAEEAGVTAPLERLGEGAYEDDEVRVRGDVFLARTDGPFAFADGEVVETAWVAAAELPAWLAGRPLCPDSVAIALPLLRHAAGPHPV